MEKRHYKESRHEERRSQARIKRQISIVEGQNKSSRHVNAKKGQLNTALAGPSSLCDFMICSQVTLHTVIFFSAFKPSKYVQLISNTGLYLVVCVQVNHLRSWEKWLFKSNFLICKRRTRLQTAILHRSTKNSTTPLKKWLSVFSGSDFAHVSFLSAAHTDIYLPAQTTEPLAFGLGTTQCHVLQHHACDLRQQLYFCPCNEKQDLLISVYSQ